LVVIVLSDKEPIICHYLTKLVVPSRCARLGPRAAPLPITISLLA
jgi:hypothetical protein